MTKHETPEDDGLVAKTFGCPMRDCGNRRMDALSFVDDEIVECGACGTLYHVMSGQVIVRRPGRNGQESTRA